MKSLYSIRFFDGRWFKTYRTITINEKGLNIYLETVEWK